MLISYYPNSIRWPNKNDKYEISDRSVGEICNYRTKQFCEMNILPQHIERTTDRRIRKQGYIHRPAEVSNHLVPALGRQIFGQRLSVFKSIKALVDKHTLLPTLFLYSPRYLPPCWGRMYYHPSRIVLIVTVIMRILTCSRKSIILRHDVYVEASKKPYNDESKVRALIPREQWSSDSWYERRFHVIIIRNRHRTESWTTNERYSWHHKVKIIRYIL